jgi:hypothetical protein
MNRIDSSSTTGRQKVENQSIFGQKAAPETQKKVTQSFNNTSNNIQTQQQTFKWWGSFKMRNTIVN